MPTSGSRLPNDAARRWKKAIHRHGILVAAIDLIVLRKSASWCRLLGALAIGASTIVLTGCSSTADEATTGEDALTIGGCPAKPTCDDRGDDGRYCLPVCAAECRSKHVSSGFWTSPYEVSGSFGLGRHQGSAIIAVSVAFDARGDADASTGKLALAGLPDDVALRMLGERGSAHDHSRVAICGSPELIFDRPLGNHGRALSRRPEHRANRAAMVFYEADGAPSVVRDASSTAVLGGAWMKKTTTCLERIQNGYCDAVCGNCSYVLPSESIFTSRAGDWSTPDALVSGGGAASCDAPSYYGGPNFESTPTFTGVTLPNHFTHCARLGCAAADEAPSLKSITSDAADAPMTGLYGHNSNTDAEAELRAFRACVNGQDGTADACAACGNGATGIQSPCDDRTNMARAVWDKTAKTSLGIIPIDQVPAIVEASDEQATDAPTCAWGHFPVYGM